MCICIGLVFLFAFSSGLEAKKFDQFPAESCKLSELEYRAKELRANGYRKARALIDEIDRRNDNDPKIQSLSVNDAKKHKKIAGRYHPPYDNNRSGRELGLFINASDVHTKRQHYILASCPRTIKQARDLFEVVRAQKAAVFISALRSKEARHSYCNNFWRGKNLKKIHLRDNATINTSSVEVRDLRPKACGALIPRIIERTLQYSSGHTLHHLHYEGWKDKRAMPSKRLLTSLLDRIYELSPDPQVPVGINCRGGTGRSGTIAVSLYLRREVDAQLAAGKKINEIKVNIPEIIYSFRKHRKSIIGTPAQLAQIYSVLAEYYQRLCKKETEV